MAHVTGETGGSNLSDLEMTERHVREGLRHVARQKEILARLEALDGDVVMAAALLVQFESALAEHEAHRDRILAAMAGDSVAPD